MKHRALFAAIVGVSLVGMRAEAQFPPGTRVRYLTRTESVVPFEGEYAGRIADTILVARPKAPLEPLVRVSIDSITDFSYQVAVPRGGAGPALIGGTAGFEIASRVVSFDGGGGLSGLMSNVFKFLLFTVGGATIGVLIPTHEWRGIDPHLIQVTGDVTGAPRFGDASG